MKRLLFAFVAVLLSAAAFAQETVDVKGTVLDENGWPLTGAYVLVQGTSNGTLTDISRTRSAGDGAFRIPDVAPVPSAPSFTTL